VIPRREARLRPANARKAIYALAHRLPSREDAVMERPTLACRLPR
jgi:hypothetical protein